MTVYVLGVNCHVILSHADIDAGAPYGFISPKDGTIREGGAQFIRQVDSETTSYSDIPSGTRLWVNFDIICADDLIEPNGSPHSAGRLVDYAKLAEFLSKPSGIQCTTPVGTFANLGALGFSADERHLPEHSIIRCQLNNVGFYFPPRGSRPTCAFSVGWTFNLGNFVLGLKFFQWSDSCHILTVLM